MLINDKIAAKLGSIIAVTVVKGAALEPSFDIDPNCFEVPGTQPGTLQAIRAVNFPIPVK